MGRLDIEDVTGTLDVKALRPISDFLLLEAIHTNRSRGGIILPKGENVESAIGRVIATGPGTTNEETGEVYPLQWKPGDIVLTMRYMGDQVFQPGGGEYRLVRENGIWATLVLGDDHALDIRKCIPAKDCILLEPERDSVSQGGIVLPGGEKTQNCKGLVLAVGNGYRNLKTGAVIKPSVRGGETVIFRRYAGAEIEVKGYKHKLRLMQDRDLFAVIED